MPKKAALEQAIHLFLLPAGGRALQTAPLPCDIDFLLRLLARDAAAEAQAVQRTGRPIEIIREAAEYFVKQAMFSPQASAYRTLGAPSDASRDVLRTNMGLLLRWLHPDHRSSIEHQIYFDRVLKAWETLGSPESRVRYDLSLEASAPLRPRASMPTVRAPFFATSVISGGRRSARHRRRRRRMLLLALAMLAAAGMAWIGLERGGLGALMDPDRLFRPTFDNSALPPGPDRLVS